MKQINAGRLSALTHKGTASLKFPNDEGEMVTEEVTVIVRGMSPRVARDIQESFIDRETGQVEIARFLDGTVLSLPEVVGDDGEPVELTYEFYDQMEPENLNSLYAVVKEIYYPNGTTSSV